MQKLKDLWQAEEDLKIRTRINQSGDRNSSLWLWLSAAHHISRYAKNEIGEMNPSFNERVSICMCGQKMEGWLEEREEHEL